MVVLLIILVSLLLLVISILTLINITIYIAEKKKNNIFDFINFQKNY
jgi:hypothetical protein